MMILKNEYFTEDEARAFLKLFTGQNYVFAQGSCRKWGSEEADVTYQKENRPYFQIMPKSTDNG